MWSSGIDWSAVVNSTLFFCFYVIGLHGLWSFNTPPWSGEKLLLVKNIVCMPQVQMQFLGLCRCMALFLLSFKFHRWSILAREYLVICILEPWCRSQVLLAPISFRSKENCLLVLRCGPREQSFTVLLTLSGCRTEVQSAAVSTCSLLCHELLQASMLLWDRSTSACRHHQSIDAVGRQK
jgi:hypothetical protein